MELVPLLCALTFVLPSAIGIYLIFFFRRTNSPNFRLSDAWVPCWVGFHPAWLLLYRLLVFLSMSSILIALLLHAGPSVFYFYTQWTFMLVILYFALATFISAIGCWNCAMHQPIIINEVTHPQTDPQQTTTSASPFITNANANETAAWSWKHQAHHVYNGNQQIRARVLGYTMHILYQTCAGAVMLTDIVFWGLLVPFLTSDTFRVTPLMACIHTLNLVFLLFDTAVHNMSLPLFGMVYFVLWSSAYVTFQWILHACGFKWWAYPFLDLATPWAPLWYLAIALVHVPCYGFYFLVAKAKDSLLGKWFPNAYIKAY